MIILDMDMPKCCSECDFETHDEYELTNECVLIYKGYTNSTRNCKRLDNCPLHEVTDSDTISRKQTLEHLKKRLYESALNNDGIASKIFEEIADNRVQIWMDELPPSPSRPTGYWMRMSDLNESEDDRYKCSCCGNVVHHRDKVSLYTYNSWCGACGANMNAKNYVAYIQGGAALATEYIKQLPSAQPELCGDVVSRNAIVQKLNEMDRYVSTELRLCDTDKKFPQNEVFIVDDVYEEIVEQLPSAQPETHEERTETHACDCISRKEAIDAFLTELTKRERKNLLHTWSTVEVKYFITKMLEQMPSAQPDLPIKEKCAFCPHCNNCDVNDDLSIQPCMDTISRQAAMEEISKQQTYKMFEGEDTLYLDANDVGSVLASLPSAERKNGKWIDNHTTCSECGWQMIDDVMQTPNMVGFNFCPNCGADMREEGEADADVES